ncbi:MAG: ChbG/HpnK family deacetylase [Limisphaerales bacterium]
MLIVNADDWGRDRVTTDTALTCYHARRISSTSAMVFMADSPRAAGLAKSAGIDVGLHINFTLRFDGDGCPDQILKSQDRLRRFLKPSKRTQILYMPFLRKHFRCVVEAQLQEFSRLYGQAPSHIDGHQHMHLSTNMLADRLIPAGQRVRRNFSCLAGENPGGFFKRTYLRAVDRFLGRHYRLTDYFFGLSDRRKQCVEKDRIVRVFHLANTASVELMTHPIKPCEREFLLSKDAARLLATVEIGTHSML